MNCEKMTSNIFGEMEVILFKELPNFLISSSFNFFTMLEANSSPMLKRKMAAFWGPVNLSLTITCSIPFTEPGFNDPRCLGRIFLSHLYGLVFKAQKWCGFRLHRQFLLTF